MSLWPVWMLADCRRRELSEPSIAHSGHCRHHPVVRAVSAYAHPGPLLKTAPCTPMPLSPSVAVPGRDRLRATPREALRHRELDQHAAVRSRAQKTHTFPEPKTAPAKSAYGSHREARRKPTLPHRPKVPHSANSFAGTLPSRLGPGVYLRASAGSVYASPHQHHRHFRHHRHCNRRQCQQQQQRQQQQQQQQQQQ